MTPMMEHLVRPLAAALGFLTIAPVGGIRVEQRHLGRSAGFFPLVGLGLGLLLWGLSWLLWPRLPALLVGLLLTATLALCSRALHLDGLADLFDGLGGARGDRERALQIMKDSRVGAFGATALALVLMAKVLALGEAAGRGAWPLLVLAPAVARACVVPLVVLFPYARARGLGTTFTRQSGAAQLALSTAIAAGAVACTWDLAAAVALPVAATTALVVAAVAKKRLGGLTGDVYGAAIELSETAFVLAGLAATAA